MDPTNLYSGYARASAYSRVPRKTLKKALKPYHFDLGSATGKSDVQLRHMAARAVLRKFNKTSANDGGMRLGPVINKPPKTFKRMKKTKPL